MAAGAFFWRMLPPPHIFGTDIRLRIDLRRGLVYNFYGKIMNPSAVAE